MAQISEHINSLNNKIHSYDQMIKMIVNVVSRKGKNNNNHTFQVKLLHNLLLVSIFDTPEKRLLSVDSEIRHEKSTYIISKVTINIILFINTCNV